MPEKKRILLSLIFPLIFVVFLWIVKITEHVLNINFVQLGLHPLDPKGIPGILLGPLIHGSWKHLFNNTFPLLFLSWAIFFFYKEIAFKVFFLVYFMSQFWLWFFAREGWHIGASGIIYGFGAFTFISGIIRRNKKLLAISMLVAFLYGSMVWGILPVEEHISWEGHLMGTIAGIILAMYYKNHGSGSDIITLDDEEDEEYEYEYWNDYNEESEHPINKQDSDNST